MRQGAFEREINSWAYGFVNWIRSHERFTWINLLICLVPTPLSSLFGVVLAIVQLILIHKGRIPSSEVNILKIALILGILNTIFTSFALIFLFSKGLSFGQYMNPLWLLEWIKQNLHMQPNRFKSV